MLVHTCISEYIWHEGLSHHCFQKQDASLVGGKPSCLRLAVCPRQPVKLLKLHGQCMLAVRCASSLPGGSPAVSLKNESIPFINHAHQPPINPSTHTKPTPIARHFLEIPVFPRQFCCRTKIPRPRDNFLITKTQTRFKWLQNTEWN